jgi:regulator of protease activity HflC (stomatin/prohibitin superfamily)
MPPITFDFVLKIIVAIALALFFLATAFISFAVKIVPENKRIVLFRAGRSLGTRGPGIVTVIPLIDMVAWVDLQSVYRFRYSSVPASDNRKISCQVTLEGKVIDPEKSVLNVPNLEKALYKVIETEIIDIARDKKSDELIHLDGWLEYQLKDVAYRSSRSWGFDIIKLTIGDIQQV